MNENDYIGVIYKITNIQNRKCYIGKTISIDYIKYIDNHFRKALQGKYSKKHFYNAIRKYGKQNFKIQILGKIVSPSFEGVNKKLNKAEIESIWLFRSFGADGEHFDGTYGYNMTLGGEGCSCSGENNYRFGKTDEDLWEGEKLQEIKERRSFAQSGKNNGMYGTGGFYKKWVEKYGEEVANEMKKETYLRREETKENRTDEEKAKFSKLRSFLSSKENNGMYGTGGFYKKWVEKFGKETADIMKDVVNKKHSETFRNKPKNEKDEIIRKMIETNKNKTNEEKQKTIEKRKNTNESKSDEEKQEIKKKISEAYKNLSEEDKLKRKKKFQETMKNKSDEEKQEWKRKVAHKGKDGNKAKKYILTTPEGIEIFLHGEFSRYCKENNLNIYFLNKVANNKLDNWNGWKCKKLED